MLSQLCEKCQQLFDNWPEFVPKLEMHDAPDHYDIFGLKLSASKGCHLCVLFLSHGETRQHSTVSTGLERPLSRIIFGGHDGRWHLNLLGGEIFSHLILVKADSGSAAAHSLVDKWYKQCRSSHEKCASIIRAELPTRLLDLQTTQQGENVRLCDTKGLQSQTPYATLSHCWGKLAVLSLTQHNACQLYQKIALDDLCKTFKDAIYIARSHGLRYLWIDALCIKQDDREDWRFESLRMTSVYGASTLNIAAAGAQDGSAGCFLNRHPLVSQRCLVGLPLRGNTRRMLHECVPRDLSHHCVRGMPLGKRAWAFQERFLAPRTIHYSATQLFWQCEQLDACEMYPEGIPDILLKKTYQTKALSAQSWSVIVEQYTGGSLTRENDKLPAIAGVARLIAEKSQDQYLAGLWRKNVECQLLWEVADKAELHRKRPNVYRAPSWSWASVEGPVRRLINLLGPASSMRINILEINMKTVNDDPFGEVLSGSLRLSCSAVLRGTGIDYEYSLDLWKFKLEDGTMIEISGAFDAAGDSGLHSCLLPVLADDDTIQGLVLRPCSSIKGQFYRVGCFHLYGSDYRSYKKKRKNPQNWLPESECEEVCGIDEDGFQRIIITIV